MQEARADQSRPERGCCCTPRRRRSVNDYFDLGRQRIRAPVLAVEGAERRLDDAIFARFSLRLEDERIAAVSFRASLCITLVAYCELLAELAEGRTLAEAVRLSATELVAEMPGVPVIKQDRATLATCALFAAVQKAVLHPQPKE